MQCARLGSSPGTRGQNRAPCVTAASCVVCCFLLYKLFFFFSKVGCFFGSLLRIFRNPFDPARCGVDFSCVRGPPPPLFQPLSLYSSVHTYALRASQPAVWRPLLLQILIPMRAN